MNHRRVFIGTAVALAVAVLTTAQVLGGAEKVAFPVGYTTEFVRYSTVDRPDRKPPIVRFLYAHPDALASARPGEPLPDGTVIVMEDHKAQLDDGGAAIIDANGRFLPTSEITNIFIQEKRAGWGTEYPEEVRNGDWEYARFSADGSRMVGDNVKFDGCFACHKGVADQDFNFSLSPFIARIKGE